MIAYLDASVLLRVVLAAPNALAEWSSIDHMVASSIIQVEAFRTLDRLRITEGVIDAEVTFRRNAVKSVLSLVDSIEVAPHICRLASQPLSVPLKTLDAIHLASAMWWRERRGELTFTTHDAQLARAARSVGFHVLGIQDS
ncbi:MAG: hypothetical protein JWO56_2176 [Acidobacteria bacterium]|nr:hypothetical protein [Acidobacteriota bacterium]